jgi:hypothetical protein
MKRWGKFSKSKSRRWLGIQRVIHPLRNYRMHSQEWGRCLLVDQEDHLFKSQNKQLQSNMEVIGYRRVHSQLRI